jgi:CTP-dependent riboflavin kinase
LMHVLRGIIGSRYGVATQNLKTVEQLLLERAGLPSMAPGTLNVTLPFDYVVRPDATIELHEYFTGERIKLQRCRVRGRRMIIMRPDSHELPGGIGANVLELISPLHLRIAWGLGDLEKLEVEVEGGQS